MPSNGQPPPSPVRKLRIAMYSHDTMGLGHMRRNLLLAQSFAADPVGASVLLIAGASEVNALHLPDGVDCLSLPALQKSSAGDYSPRRLSMPLEELTHLRSETIRAALAAFSPDVLIVDNIPRGAGGELDATLKMLADDPLARCVLGLRDILDDPVTVNAQWDEADNVGAIGQFYDAVWVYGDADLFDCVKQYGWPAGVAEKLSFTGYLDPRGRLVSQWLAEDSRLPGDFPQRFAACLCGGGQDGFEVAQAFLKCSLPDDMGGIVLAGPCMPSAELNQLRQLAAANRRKLVWDFVPEADTLIAVADRIVAMGGYNTICSVVCHEKPALIVPRRSPRQEQSIRARCFAKRNLIDLVDANSDLTAEVSAWLRKEVRKTKVKGVGFNGLQRAAALLQEVISQPRRNQPSNSASRDQLETTEKAHVGK